MFHKYVKSLQIKLEQNSNRIIFGCWVVQEASDALEDSDVDEVADVAPRARAPRAAAARKAAIIELSSSEDEEAADSDDDFGVV